MVRADKHYQGSSKRRVPHSKTSLFQGRCDWRFSNCWKLQRAGRRGTPELDTFAAALAIAGMSSVFTSILQNKQWCSVVTRKARSRRFSAVNRVCRWAKGISAPKSHDYYPNGTVTLFAVLDYLEGKVIAHTAQKHTRRQWLEFLKQIDREIPLSRHIHRAFPTDAVEHAKSCQGRKRGKVYCYDNVTMSSFQSAPDN